MPKQTSNRTDSRVVDFREAAASRARAAQQAAARQSPVADLAQYEHAPDDDYRHRMVTNGIALAFTAILVIAGIWIADSIAAMRKNQDCVLSGRRGCTPVEAPILHR